MNAASSAPACLCATLSDPAVVPMGSDGLDERVFATIDRFADHGGDQWWLYASHCSACGQDWMVAQDERIYDNFYLTRITPETRRQIVEQGRWPDDFMTYEQVLRLGRTLSKPWTFWDLVSGALVDTAADLRHERPGITTGEIAWLLGISEKDAARLDKPGLLARLRGWIERR